MKYRIRWTLSLAFALLAVLPFTVLAAQGDQDIWVISTEPDIDIIVRETLAEGLSEPMTLQVANDGRIFFVQRGGAVRLWDEKNGMQNLLQLSTYTGNEHGLIGIALDPDFDENHYIYLYLLACGEPRR